MTPEERITYLEEAVERLAEHIDLLAYLHDEQRHRLQALMLKVVLSQPEALEKMQQLNALVTAAKAAKSNGEPVPAISG
jgi:hypothetical protein